MMKYYQLRPCAECPWRRDVPTGKFPATRFRHMAKTAYDLALVQFGCHMLENVGCAGFALRGATHNLGARLALHDGGLALSRIGDGGYPLYDDYRAMAVANGVALNDPALKRCR
jgi:hypothetical protein